MFHRGQRSTSAIETCAPIAIKSDSSPRRYFGIARVLQNRRDEEMIDSLNRDVTKLRNGIAKRNRRYFELEKSGDKFVAQMKAEKAVYKMMGDVRWTDCGARQRGSRQNSP